MGHVLDLPHKLDDADLVLTPYFDFLQPTQSLTPQDSGSGSQNTTERNSEDLSDMQTSHPIVVDDIGQPSSQTAMESLTAHETFAEAAEEVMEDKDTISGHIAIADPVKLVLFQLGTFKQETEKAHPDVIIQVKDDGVHIADTDRQTFEQIKHSILEYFSKMAEIQFTLEPEKAEFLARRDVKERLHQIMTQTGLPAVYTISDNKVVVTALSANSADQACGFLKSQLGQVSIPVDSEYECLFCCREWSAFVQALGFCSVKVSERGGNIDVLTLKGMESEKQTAILDFLATPIERETVISMEPGVLKYIQIHCHQLLADMEQVTIFPQEADDVCGLKVCGARRNRGHCCGVFSEIPTLTRLFCFCHLFLNVPCRFMASPLLVKWLRRCCKALSPPSALETSL